MKQITITIPEIQDVEFTLTCLPEDIQIEGNASAIDPETDKEIADDIRQQLERGNSWAWCVVKVEAKWKGLKGSDILGGCSYKSEKDFVDNSCYYEDMKQTAYCNLLSNLGNLND
jgi:hypothetical protein